MSSRSGSDVDRSQIMFDRAARARTAWYWLGVKPHVGLEVTPSIRLLRQVGAGGMGSVWVAHHAGLEIDVAVKFLLPELQTVEGALRRFSEEAMVAAQIKSPHVVQVLDHGVLGEELPFIVMELLEGEDLAAFVARRGPLNLADTAAIVQQLGRVLRKAHAAGIVHRDVKPENVFLLGGDDELFVKLIDFGIAKWSTRERALTATGTMVGTPDFMCPEQIASAKDVGPEADSWAVAGVAYFTLLGRAPFGRETIPRTFVAIEKGEFSLPFSCHGIGTAALDAFFAKAFHRDPARRFASLRELTAAFCDAAEVPITRRLRLVTASEEGLETWVDSSGVAVSVGKRAAHRVDLLNPLPPAPQATRIGPVGPPPVPPPPGEVVPVVPPVETVRGVTLESAGTPPRADRRGPERLAPVSVRPASTRKGRQGVGRRLALAAVAAATVGWGGWAAVQRPLLLRQPSLIRDYLGEWTAVIAAPARALRFESVSDRSLVRPPVEGIPPARALVSRVASISGTAGHIQDALEPAVHELTAIPVEALEPVEAAVVSPRPRQRLSAVRMKPAPEPEPESEVPSARLKDRGF